MSQVFGEDGLEHLGFASMKGLKQFMCTSTDTIHYVIVSTENFRSDGLFDCLVYLMIRIQQKLCLLIMSLPAFYLCTEQVILAFQVEGCYIDNLLCYFALQFVCEFFLKISSKLIDDLREIRQLPGNIQLHPPDSLFGVPVGITSAAVAAAAD